MLFNRHMLSGFMKTKLLSKLILNIYSPHVVHVFHIFASSVVFVAFSLNTAQTAHIIHVHHIFSNDNHSSNKRVIKKQVVATTPPPKPKSTPKPPPPSPQPTSSVSAPSASVNTPVSTATKSASTSAPATVSSVAASPGKSVGSLSPTPTSSSSTSSSSTTSSTSSSSSTVPANSYTSTNWAGYVALSATYTAINADWTIPTVTGISGETTADASWIGIGGVKSSDLIQIGTEDTVSPSGVQSNAVFYELLPNSPVYPTTINVQAGDIISASIAEISTDLWTISITDKTTNVIYSTNVTYSSSYSSAEWIEEDPSYSDGSLVPFDNFHSLLFNQGQVTANNVVSTIAGSSASMITLVDSSNNPVATPSTLDSTGTSFSVTRN